MSIFTVRLFKLNCRRGFGGVPRGLFLPTGLGLGRGGLPRLQFGKLLVDTSHESSTTLLSLSQEELAILFDDDPGDGIRCCIIEEVLKVFPEGLLSGLISGPVPGAILPQRAPFCMEAKDLLRDVLGELSGDPGPFPEWEDLLRHGSRNSHSILHCPVDMEENTKDISI